MRRQNTETLGTVIAQFLKTNKLQKPLDEKHAIDAWQTTLGKNVMDYTRDLQIKNGVLYVSITSSVLRHDLFLTRDEIRDKINAQAGSEVVKQIILR
jgi:predicted nucleic acid-binding Zn ribbon protein